jgi:hypothetical protein
MNKPRIVEWASPIEASIGTLQGLMGTAHQTTENSCKFVQISEGAGTLN